MALARRALMSSATKSSSITRSLDPYGLLSTCVGGLTAGVRAIAFWTAALLPLLIVGGLATGAAAQYPQLFVGAMTVNLVCAVLGHNHSPH